MGKFKGIVTVESEEDRKWYLERKKDLIHNLKMKINTLSVKKLKKGLDFKLK